MTKIELTFEEEFGLTDVQRRELMANKLLTAWGVPDGGMTLYGRLKSLEDTYPDLVKTIMDVTSNTAHLWYYKPGKQDVPQLFNKKQPGWIGPFESWQRAMQHSLDDIKKERLRVYRQLRDLIPDTKEVTHVEETQ